MRFNFISTPTEVNQIFLVIAIGCYYLVKADELIGVDGINEFTVFIEKLDETIIAQQQYF